MTAKFKARKGLVIIIGGLIAATSVTNILIGHRALFTDGERLDVSVESWAGKRADVYRGLSAEGDAEGAGEMHGGGDGRPSESDLRRPGAASDNNPKADLNFPRLPNVLLLGAQKGGSSALSEWLFGHGVCRPRKFRGEPDHWNKEVHFFDKEDRWRRGPDFYADRFRHCFNGTSATRTRLAMDASPNNLPYPEKVRRLYEKAGGGQADSLKLIISLREPVSRELSLYNHKANEFRERKTSNVQFWRGILDMKKSERTNELVMMSFDDYVNQKLLGNINATDGSCTFWGHVNQCLSLYAFFLKRWMRWFQRDQILVLAYDELVQDQHKVMWRIRKFLGLDEDAGPGEVEASNTQETVHKISLPPCSAQAKLAQRFERANENLYSLLEEEKGPSVEQRPFPKFVLSNCTSNVAGW